MALYTPVSHLIRSFLIHRTATGTCAAVRLHRTAKTTRQKPQCPAQAVTEAATALTAAGSGSNLTPSRWCSRSKQTEEYALNIFLSMQYAFSGIQA